MGEFTTIPCTDNDNVADRTSRSHAHKSMRVNFDLTREWSEQSASMSWLSGIAGRAEALLDRMDQAAATSIQSTGLATPQRGSGPGTEETTSRHHTSLSYEPTASVAVERPHSVPSKTSTSVFHSHKTAPYSPVARPEAPPKTTPTPSSYNAYSKSRSSSDANDDSIFQFLNTPSKQPAMKSQPPTAAKNTLSNPQTAKPDKEVAAPYSDARSLTPLSEESVDREGGGEEPENVDGGEDSTTSSSQEKPEEEADTVREGEIGEDEKTDHDSWVSGPVTEQSQPTGESESQPHDPQSEAAGKDVGKEGGGGGGGERERDVIVQNQPKVGGGNNKEQIDQQLVGLQRKVSDLELENRLLKREVTSLNDELGTVLERVREAEEGVASHRKEAESLREQVSASERVIRQLRSHDEDAQATLQARDSQIQVLRKELHESETRETTLRVQLEGQGKEKERLLHDASRSSEASSHALEVLKTQLQQTEEQLIQEREAALRAKLEFAESESSLRRQQQQLSDSVESQHRQLALLQSKVAESQRSVQAAHRELSQANREHEEYKKRAAGILQAKEKVIASLQEGGAGVSGSAHEATLEQLRLEKEAVRAELETARQQGEGLKAELQEVEEQHSQEVAQLTEQVRELERQLESEKVLQRSATEDLQRLVSELSLSREQWEREKTSLTALIKEKETKIEELKAKEVVAGLSSSQVELEARLHELTESLIKKQTTLEALGSERNSLRLQLERTESQLAAARKATPPSAHTTIKGLDTTTSENHIRPMTSVLPLAGPTHLDNRLHNVRRAMNTVDSFSVRLAVFLRRYPYARLFLIFYMVLLHVWVLVVLLTYTPEAHSPSDLAPHET